jgi:hypothetical protein
VTALEELKRREPLFYRPELGTTRTDFERMISADYWEIGASGNRYDRELVLRVLEERRRQPVQDIWETSDFRMPPTQPNTYLLTYQLLQDGTRKIPRHETGCPKPVTPICLFPWPRVHRDIASYRNEDKAIRHVPEIPDQVLLRSNEIIDE